MKCAVRGGGLSSGAGGDYLRNMRMDADDVEATSNAAAMERGGGGGAGAVVPGTLQQHSELPPKPPASPVAK